MVLAGGSGASRAFPQLSQQTFQVEVFSGNERIDAGVEGQGEGEGAADAGFAFDPDFAAVMFDNLFANGQSQASASGFVFEDFADLFEAIEDLGLMLFVNADACVNDADEDFAISDPGMAFPALTERQN